jgi:GDP-mannose pyrophosphatase NudK
MTAIQILNKETIAHKKYPLKWITFQKNGPDGELEKQEKEVYFRPDAVGVLPVDKMHKKLLLTRQFRLPAFLNGSDSGYLVETCAGIIDENETPEQTAIREAMEETGFEINDLTKIAGVYSSAGGITEFVHLFIAAYNSKAKHEKGGGLKEEGEDIEVLEMDFDEAREKLNRGEFRDAKTMILLQYFFMKG